MGLNKLTGEYPVEIGGEVYPLRYTWAALAELQAELGEDYDTVISAALGAQDVKIISKAVACGLNGALTADEVFKASPSLVATVAAVMGAIRFAYYGPTGAPKPERIKKKVLQKILTLSKNLIRRPVV